MGKIFKRGLFALAPVAISVAIVLWLFTSLEDIFRIPVKWAVGEYYFPGMGLLVAIVFIFFVGIIINNFLIQKFTVGVDRLFARIPLLKTLYTSVTDMMNYFQPKDPSKVGKMVVVELDDLRFLAIMTRDDLEGLPKELGGDDRVNIFVPLSYQIGGFTMTIPKSKVKLIDMSVEQGMRFVVTAGMVGTNNNKSVAPKKSPS